MADFTINENTIRTINPLTKFITLTAGQKLSDDAEILSMAQKVVPNGYEVDVLVRIKIKDIRVIE